MSAPKTNIDKQNRRHRGPLVGMWIAVGLVLLLFVIWLLWVFAFSEPNEEFIGDEVPGTQGEVETTAPTETIEPGPESENAPQPMPEVQ